MEQKKTLWIIAATGVFLLVILGAAKILYTPAQNQGTRTAYNSNSVYQEKPDESGWTNPAKKTGELVVISDNTTVYGISGVNQGESDESKNEFSQTTDNGQTIDLNALKNEILNEQNPQNINITVNIPETKTVSSEEIRSPEYEYNFQNEKEIAALKNPESFPAVNSSVLPEKTSESKNVVVKTNSSNSEKNVNSKQNSTNSVKNSQKTEKTEIVKKSAPKQITQFWVQVAAYSNKKTAENARTTLDSNKIPSGIYTYKDNKDNLFYRVRVGPYTTKSEAEYWKAKIIQLEEFKKAESYITSTVSEV